MEKIIAGIYELSSQIGAGGGGVVYIGRHLRLNKIVVLKADKRTLKVGVDKLRREVDLLKNLSHTYIPQVYDFVEEDGVVYTVMDYVEGESLDKLLARNQLPSQPELIKWACELLDALSYLHNRPPYGILHGDIKPANIMLRPNGDICLIDFNIALALGEEGAVKVGFSRGYASPEHYEADYIVQNQKAGAQPVADTEDKTTVDTPDSDKTEVESSLRGLSGVGSSVKAGSKGILLDVRSDIYSLGATLYHLLSGKRPAQDAREVVPLGTDVCSKAVADIISKAMAPMPDDRYQTAEEMLEAFRQLHSHDVRLRRHKRHIKMAAAACSLLFLAGGFVTMVGMKQMEQRQQALALAEYSAGALEQGDVTGAISQALQAIPQDKSIWNAPVTAQAQKALTDALGVYDLAEGYQAQDALQLPSAPFGVAFSPEGIYCAALYAYEVAIYRMDDLELMAALPIQQSALSDCIFTDETHLLYAGEAGITLYDIEQNAAVWTGEEATAIALSSDAKVAAAVNRDACEARLYDTEDGTVLGSVTFYNQHMAVPVNDTFADFGQTLFSLNGDGSLLAVSFSNGGLYIIDTNNQENDLILYDESDYSQFSGGFCNDILAVNMQNTAGADFILIDTQSASVVGGFSSQDAILLQADDTGIYLANGSVLTKLDVDTMTEQEIAYTEDAAITAFYAGEEYTIVGRDDNAFSFYDSGANCMSTWQTDRNAEFVSLAGRYALAGNRSETAIRVMSLEGHEEAALLHYDAHYPHDEARVSTKYDTVMLFSYQDFRIYDKSGNMLTEVSLPESEQIYDQQFRRIETADYLEVIWYDGTVRQYSASDGTLLSQEQTQARDKELLESFETSKYRISSSLHGAPQVYALDSGEYICDLESDDYLTYVTECGGFLITEYINTAGERYGLLLNERFEVLAKLPGLCDVLDDELIFDYESGNMRHSRLYSLQELIALGETYIPK